MRGGLRTRKEAAVNSVRSLHTATLSNVGRLFDDLFAIFDARDFKALFVNAAGMAFLDPARTAQQENINLLEILGVSDRDRFQQEVAPQARVLGVWAGALTLRDLSGSETNCQVKIVEASDAEYAGLWRFYLHAYPASAEGPAAGHVSDSDVLYALLETIPDRVYFKDAQSRFLRLSRALVKSLGAKDAAEVAGKTDFDYFTPEHAAPAFQQEKRIMETGEALVDIEEKETHSDGRIGWVSTTKLPFRRRDGTLIGTYGISRDITEWKIAEEAMRENLALFRAVFNGSSDAILLISEGKLIDCNTRSETMFGYDRAKILTLSPADISPPLQPDGRPSREASEAYMRQCDEKGCCRFEWMLQGADGTTFPSEVSLSCFDFLGKRIVCASVRDIRDRKKAEEERLELESRLQLTSKLEAVGSLAAGVAHEINTPTQFISDNVRFLVGAFGDVNAVLVAYRELAKLTADPVEFGNRMAAVKKEEIAHELEYMMAEIPRCLEESLEGLRRISKIVGSLKEFSHPGGKDQDNADLNRAIETTVAVSRHEWKYVADVVTELDPGLPKVPCVLDEINQALLNLIVNASHAIEEQNKRSGVAKGLITIRTRVDGANVVVEVQDSGTGIPEQVRGHIFEPFFTTKPVGKGTGQGLAIVQSVVVKKHHGAVTFTTEIGKGTTFILSLPLTPPPPESTNHSLI